MTCRSSVLIALTGSLALANCAVVDSTMPYRVDAANHGYDTAGNDEILTNIVRASYSQPLRFYQHTKIAPSQMSDVKVGLPTFTVGPGQVLAQKQFVSANNSLDNSASISYEIDPIETKDFQSGVLTPTSMGEIGVLLGQLPREVVFFTLFEAVRVKYQVKRPGGQPYTVIREYRNDPSLDDPNACPDFDYSTYNITSYAEAPDSISYYHPGRELYEHASYNCSFHQFQFYIEEALKFGVTIQYSMADNPKYNANDTKSTQPKQILVGGLCYDLALARPEVVQELNLSSSLCDRQNNQPKQDKTSAALAFAYYPPQGHKVVVSQQIDVVPRSILGIYRYLGRLLSTQTGSKVELFSREARVTGDRSLLTVDTGLGASCFARAHLDLASYCVPSERTDSTKLVFQIISALTNLSTATSDVPTSLSVRVTP